MNYSKTNILLGLPLMSGGEQELNHEFLDAVKSERPCVIAHLNLHALYLTSRNSGLRTFFQKARFVYCDGEAVRWAAKILGCAVPEKVGLTRWIWNLAALCEKEKRSIYLLGGGPGIAEMAARNMVERFPLLQISGVKDGHFDFKGPQNKQVIEAIQKLKPDVIIVALGMPLQEFWIEEHLSRFQKGVFIPGGGVLDYVSGRLGKAPSWMIRGHLEWLFRIWQEPRRLLKRYLIEIPWLLIVLLREKLSKK